ncbi:hypothetical protein GCM10010371_12840 [Streptomyces subrutilus]|uniref:Uncharacterized protein n=1 Tax=Streptomyces subrutilus TaxID=36818 RepID=A0A918V1Q7_9ACTN|nr:hypothetical protein GCM10010371_12840 [Streptomyces subrutilus]
MTPPYEPSAQVAGKLVLVNGGTPKDPHAVAHPVPAPARPADRYAPEPGSAGTTAETTRKLSWNAEKPRTIRCGAFPQ